MPLLGQDVRDKLGEFYADLKRDVDLRFYPGPEGEASDVMRQLLNEMAEVSPRLKVSELDRAPAVEPGRDSDALAEGPITEVTASDAGEGRVRFLGVASGHEFGALVAAIRHASMGTDDISPGGRERLASLRHPVHIQVFTTPT